MQYHIDMKGFADEVKIEVKAGDGGNGAISFRHEKYVNKGGPDGGDGGHGGNVVLKADHNLNTLVDLAKRKRYEAEEGKAGSKQKSAGRAGEDLILRVPVGTQVYELDESEEIPKEYLVADLSDNDDEFVVAKGGEGGYGNAHFARASFQTPQFADLGEPGEEKEVVLKLKIVADVGLVGLPNVGKSTLLSVISNAKPKIANYEFTTLIPNLGIARYKNTSFVVADIPGLIEGASSGKGLGHQFLRHIERTRLLVHVLDATREDIKQDFDTIIQELKNYNPILASRPKVVVFNKIDILTPEQLKAVKKLKLPGQKIHFISATTHDNLNDLLDDIVELLTKIPHEDSRTVVGKVFTLDDLPYARFEVFQESDHYLVKGPKQERIAIKTDFENPQAVGRFLKVFKRMGVMAELKKIGAMPGNKVRVANKEFVFENL